MNFCLRVVCALIFLGINISTQAASPSALVTPQGWENWIQESGKKYGGTSSFTCSTNQVMVGRQHSGDENGNTRYQCATITIENYRFSTNPNRGVWSSWIQESGKKTGGTSSYVCPTDQLMITREHSGDENGNTRYQCVPVTYNGNNISLLPQSWSSWIQESGKKTGGTSSYVCPTNQVMIGRQHSGDENGNTRYLCATVSAPYTTTALQTKYRGENVRCAWQDNRTQRCPPYVTYLDDDLRQSLLIKVSAGKLVNTQGLNFDTTNADGSHSGPAAIFTMGAYGNIYASNPHPVYMFHHSSFYAGQPVASAGELYVTSGKITGLTNCSGHYMPSDALAKQAITALKNQGYSDTFPYYSCSGMNLDYLMALMAGSLKSPPVKLIFSETYTRFLGPGKTFVCTEDSPESCQTPALLKVPSNTSVMICNSITECKSYIAGEHPLNVGKVNYIVVEITK